MTDDESATRQTDDDRAAAAWRAVGREATLGLFIEARGNLEDALYPIEDALHEDRAIDATAIRDARNELDELRWVLEEHLTQLADGDDVEPWGEGVGSTVPYGVMIEQLETSGIGYRVERRTDE